MTKTSKPETKLVRDWTERDRLIVAYALSFCPVAKLGDRLGGSDSQTAERLIELATVFDKGIADDMAVFKHQFK